ncbi:MAG TPA: alkaline phosphatase family protein [Solirubrobacterales bacterium]
MATQLQRATAAAASLSDKRFGLLIASSLVATSAIVASGLGPAGGDGALAALLGRSLAADTSAATSPASTSQPAPGSASQSPKGATTQAAEPLGVNTPAPSPAPEAPANDLKPPSDPTTSTSPASSGPVGPIKHVFVISLASPGYEQSFGSISQMPYLSGTLRPQGQLVPGYSLLAEAALPNNIATISGQPPNQMTESNCSTYAPFPLKATPNKKGVVPGSGCIYPVEALTVADQISGARLRWHAYMEDMVDENGPHNCVQPQPNAPDEPPAGGYAARNNPFVYFHSLLDVGDCAINDVPLEQLTKDLRKPETTPDFAFISPNLCRAGVAGQCSPGEPDGAVAADQFLAEWAPKILAAKAIKKDGLLVIAFNGLGSPGQAPATDASGAPVDPLKVGALLVSHRYVSRGGTRDGTFTPYSLLRSIEDLFGLTPLAEAGSARTVSFGDDLLGPQF